MSRHALEREGVRYGFFGGTYRVGDEREKRDILMSAFRYIVEGTRTVCDDGFFFLVRDIGGR